MITLKFNCEIYEHSIILLQKEVKDKEKDVIKVLKKHNIPDGYVTQISEGIDEGCYDGGYTFTNQDKKYSVVYFDDFSTKEMKINVYSHEKRHVEDFIIKQTNINNDDEAAAYLAGWLSVKFYELFTKYNKYIKTKDGKNK